MNQLDSRGEFYFKVFSLITMTCIAIITFLPLLLMIMSSFTDESTLVKNGYSFFPENFSLTSYQYIFLNIETFVTGFGVSMFVTVVGTAVSLIITGMIAYPISRQDFKYRNILAFIVLFTMLFNGGIVPTYMVWTKIFSIQNTLGALILPNYLLTAFNVIIVMNFFKNNIPMALVEAAKIDGAGELRIFFKIMLPLSVPVLATVGMFTSLIYWNDWINALYFVSNPQLYGLQNLLINLMNNIQFLNSGEAANILGSNGVSLPSTGIRMAMGVVATVPILLVVPFLQKYLVKGAVVGSIKG